jgi:hypothetical protein
MRKLANTPYPLIIHRITQNLISLPLKKALHLLHSNQPMTSHLSLTSYTSPISPISRFSPSSSLNFHFPSSTFSSPLSLPTLSSLHSNRFFPALKSSNLNSNSPEGEFEELEIIDDDDVEYDGDDVTDDEVDVNELELEAERVAREYAVSLSKELKIGESLWLNCGL